jgi:hypothetical protein
MTMCTQYLSYLSPIVAKKLTEIGHQARPPLSESDAFNIEGNRSHRMLTRRVHSPRADRRSPSRTIGDRKSPMIFTPEVPPNLMHEPPGPNGRCPARPHPPVIYQAVTPGTE